MNITNEMVMEKLAEFGTGSVAKVLKDKQETTPVYNQYMTDQRNAKAPAKPFTNSYSADRYTTTANQAYADEAQKRMMTTKGGLSMEDIGRGIDEQHSRMTAKPAAPSSVPSGGSSKGTRTGGARTVKPITPGQVQGTLPVKQESREEYIDFNGPQSVLNDTRQSVVQNAPEDYANFGNDGQSVLNTYNPNAPQAIPSRNIPVRKIINIINPAGPRGEEEESRDALLFREYNNQLKLRDEREQGIVREPSRVR